MYRVIFLSAFYTVAAVIAGTLVCALARARRSLARGQAERIRWEDDFAFLPAADRACRHALTGELPGRVCRNGFDCRGCARHAGLRARAEGATEENILGMAFPANRLYHRGHAWIEPQPDGSVLVGVDDLGRRIVAHPDAVELPARGARVEANGPAFRLSKRGAAIRILSPVDGEVVETGGPEKGWYLRVRPSDRNFSHLLRGAELRPWVMRELERLQLSLTGEGEVPALADGGVPVEDIPAAFPKADWDAVAGEVFLEP